MQCLQLRVINLIVPQYQKHIQFAHSHYYHSEKVEATIKTTAPLLKIVILGISIKKIQRLELTLSYIICLEKLLLPYEELNKIIEKGWTVEYIRISTLQLH